MARVVLLSVAAHATVASLKKICLIQEADVVVVHI